MHGGYKGFAEKEIAVAEPEVTRMNEIAAVATLRQIVSTLIDVQNLDGITIRFLIWNEMATAFDIAAYEAMEKPVVTTISSCRLTNRYGGFLHALSSLVSKHSKLKLANCNGYTGGNSYIELFKPNFVYWITRISEDKEVTNF